MRKRAFAMLAVVTLAFGAACSTASPFREIRGLPPCAVTLAIDDFDALTPPPQNDGAMYMTADEQMLRTMLAQGLGNARAASRIVVLSELSDPAEADIVLKPRLREPVKFECEGWASTWWASGGLWLVTWIGGMAVSDSTYNSNLALECTLTFERSGNPITKPPYASEAVDVTFLERNDFFSWPTVQSLVLPPFLTTDQEDATRDILTKRAVDSVAFELASYLKRGFEVDAQELDKCAVRFDEPENGSKVDGEAVIVRGFVTPISPVSRIALSLNGSEYVGASISAMQPVDPRFPDRCKFECAIRGLRPGENFIRVSITAGDEYTRTLAVIRSDTQ